MGYKFNPFTGNFDTTDSPNGVFDSVEVDGDITLDDGGTYTTTLQTITPTAARTISFPDATGTVGLVGGSSGQLVYNNAGAYAGAPSTSVGATGNITLSLAGAASTPPVSLTGTWFSGGTSTTTKPQLLIEPTGTTSTAWSTSGTGLGVNAASGFGGNLLDLQVNGSNKLYVDKDGNIAVPAGSQSAPSLTFTGDPNTGIYSPGADQVAISTNGAGRLFVDASGDVGVGVASPNALLHAGLTNTAGAPTTGTVALFENNTAGSNCYIQINGAYDAETGVVFTDGSQLDKGRILYSNNSEYMGFWTDGSERLRITSDGKVGLGTSSPNSLLETKGTSSGGEIEGLRLTNSSTATNTSSSIIFNLSTASATSAKIAAVRTNSPVSSDTELAFSQLSNGTLTERLRIDSTGNVGVGTTSPGTKLHLVDSSSPTLLIQDTTNNVQTLVGALDLFGQAGTGTNHDFRFLTNNTERVRIDSSGRLLVGASTAGSGGTLSVNGTTSVGGGGTGSQSSMSTVGMQLTSGISTSAATIFTSVIQGLSSAGIGHIIVYGSNNAGAGFLDVLVAVPSGTVTVLSSTTAFGSPAARTYTMSGSALQLSMASGTYSTNVRCTSMGHPF